jgi:hypothetical protein
MPDITFRLHIRILKDPFISIRNMIKFMTDVYSAHGIRPQVIGREELNLPDLQILDVGTCDHAAPLTNEQELLFNERNGAGPLDIVAYFVELTIPPLNGCARFPPGKPGLVVAHMSSRWTLAHEVGHVLGLDHVADPNDHRSLMTGSGTLEIGSTPPVLSVPEVNRIRNSPLTGPVT